MATYDPMVGSGVASLFPWLEPQLPQQPAANPQATPMVPALGGFSPMRQPPQLPTPGVEVYQGAGYTPPQNPQFGSNPLVTPFDTSNPTNGGGSGGGGGGADTSSTGSKLQQALRGVQAPKPPEVQQVRTPPPPQLVPIKGDELLRLATSLGVGPQEIIRMMQMRLGR